MKNEQNHGGAAASQRGGKYFMKFRQVKGEFEAKKGAWPAAAPQAKRKRP